MSEQYFLHEKELSDIEKQLESKDEQIKILEESLEFYRQNTESSKPSNEYFIADKITDKCAKEALAKLKEMRGKK